MDLRQVGALVFGGASGLGAATARRLGDAGADVVVADIAEERGAVVAAEAAGRFVRADVTDADQVQAAVNAAAEATRGLRISVCCSGIGPPAKVVGRNGAAPLDVFRRVIEVNLLGTINVLRLAAAAMVANDHDEDGARGVCINTASIAAYDGQVGQVPYSASKGGVVGLTLPAARDLAQHGIRVVTIAPGLFDTPLLTTLPDDARTALGRTVPFPARLGAPEEFAALVEHITANAMLNGEVIRLDGALRMAPR
jgi:NAD(P)-dependent dehydrogenase (short-subunit alcohol dehydrogenase family)